MLWSTHSDESAPQAMHAQVACENGVILEDFWRPLVDAYWSPGIHETCHQTATVSQGDKGRTLETLLQFEL